jgi:patatin-like phospholipase/acyl hydrolase
MFPKAEISEPVFRILSLDGGGIRGIFTAAFLATLEEMAGRRAGDFFDLVVGTSTGAIIGLAVALGIPARTVLDLYVERGARIFRRPRLLGSLLRPRYGNRDLERAVREIFGDRSINDVRVPVCIPSYELTNAYPRIWKDEHAAHLHWWGDQPAWRIALASAAAPLYFPAIQVLEGDSHVDGGLYANNPVLVGLTEAVHTFAQPLDRIRILSIGAGERAERIPQSHAARMGLWQWRTALFEHILGAQARGAHEIARRLLTPGQYERVNIPLERNYRLDDYRSALTLREPGAQEARTRGDDLRERFLFAPATLGRDQKEAVAADARQRKRPLRGLP